MRKEQVQDTRYGLMPLALSMPQRVEGLTSPKPPPMSRKRVETYLLSICRFLTACVSIIPTSTTDKAAREPHWWDLRRPVVRATQERRLFIILTSSFEKVRRRTITR